MAVNCPGCGRENVDEAKFCQSCGAAIPPPAAMTVIQPPDPSNAPTTSMPTVTPDAAPAYTPPAPAYTPPPPAYTPPAPAYTPPAAQPPEPVYTPAAPTYAPSAPAYQQPAYQQPVYYAQAGSRRGGVMIVGALIVLVCGGLILGSTFMNWMSYGGYEGGTGWELRQSYSDDGKNPFVNSFEYGGGYGGYGDRSSKPLFSGLCTLIAGAVLLLFALLLLLARSKGLAVVALLFSLLTLIMAGVNAYSILTLIPSELGGGMSLGSGMYLLLIGSVGGIIGSIVCLSG